MFLHLLVLGITSILSNLRNSAEVEPERKLIVNCEHNYYWSQLLVSDFRLRLAATESTTYFEETNH